MSEPGPSEPETIIVERDGRVGKITLNREKALNALSGQLIDELSTAVAEFDADPGIGAILLTGSDRAFAAGADIKEMQPKTFTEVYAGELFAGIDQLVSRRTPMIAAVAGYALGGGCELAMMCDLIIAADTAKFGQPEVNLGTIPGLGGSQRLTRAVGKAKAMDLVLTGRMMDADEAERSGLVARVVPADQLREAALEVAQTIASKSLPIAIMAKEVVDRADETTLAEGLRFESRLFALTFATEDRSEGMAAFVEKRPPDFQHR